MFVRCNRLLHWQSSWYYLEDTDRRVGEMVPSIVTVVHIADSPEFWPAPARGKKKEAAPKIPAGWKAVCASSSSVASGVGGSASSGGSGGHSTGGGHVSSNADVRDEIDATDLLDQAEVDVQVEPEHERWVEGIHRELSQAEKDTEQLVGDLIGDGVPTGEGPLPPVDLLDPTEVLEEDDVADISVGGGPSSSSMPSGTTSAGASSAGAAPKSKSRTSRVSAGPRTCGKATAVLRLPECGNKGRITFYQSNGNFVATCGNPDHGRCELTRTSNQMEVDGKTTQGRPLGGLMHWMSVCMSCSRHQHWSDTNVHPSSADRRKGRDELKRREGSAELFAEEPDPATDEDSEPEAAM